MLGRSGKRVCPVCEQKRLLVEHHIHGRDIGPSWNKPWNRVWICAACHDDVHDGRVVLEGWISTTKGKELAWHKAGETDKYLPGAMPKLYNGERKR